MLHLVAGLLYADCSANSSLCRATTCAELKTLYSESSCCFGEPDKQIGNDVFSVHPLSCKDVQYAYKTPGASCCTDLSANDPYDASSIRILQSTYALRAFKKNMQSLLFNPNFQKVYVKCNETGYEFLPKNADGSCAVETNPGKLAITMGTIGAIVANANLSNTEKAAMIEAEKRGGREAVLSVKEFSSECSWELPILPDISTQGDEGLAELDPIGQMVFGMMAVDTGIMEYGSLGIQYLKNGLDMVRNLIMTGTTTRGLAAGAKTETHGPRLGTFFTEHAAYFINTNNHSYYDHREAMQINPEYDPSALSGTSPKHPKYNAKAVALQTNISQTFVIPVRLKVDDNGKQTEFLEWPSRLSMAMSGQRQLTYDCPDGTRISNPYQHLPIMTDEGFLESDAARYWDFIPEYLGRQETPQGRVAKGAAQKLVDAISLGGAANIASLIGKVLYSGHVPYLRGHDGVHASKAEIEAFFRLLLSDVPHTVEDVGYHPHRILVSVAVVTSPKLPLLLICDVTSNGVLSECIAHHDDLEFIERMGCTPQPRVGVGIMGPPTGDPLFDASFNELAWNATLTRAYANNATAITYAGGDLNVMVGFTMQSASAYACDTFPNRTFIGVDFALTPARNNFHALLFDEYAGSFLQGVLACRRSATKIVGMIAGPKIPIIENFGNGFLAGVHYANENYMTCNGTVTYTPVDLTLGEAGFLTAFTDPTYAIETVERFVRNQSIDVIYHAAGAAGGAAIRHACTLSSDARKIFAIGVDTDQYKQGVTCAISSALKDIPYELGKLIDQHFAGTMQTTDTTMGRMTFAPFTNMDDISNVVSDMLILQQQVHDKQIVQAIRQP